jgi:endonuclease/exonuclease/phosphatase (EEP) superfamily protein YafD
VAGGALRAPEIVATLLRAEADVVALQELSEAGATQIDRALAATFPFRFFPSPSQGGGLALASRFPLRRARYRGSLAGGNGFVFAALEIDGRALEVANLHLDPIKTWTLRYGLTLPWQLLRQGAVHRRELAQVFGELPSGAGAIVVGDLNSYASDAAPDALRARGLVDGFDAVAENDEDGATHHFSIAGLRVNGRIDFVFHTPDLRTLDSRVLRGGPSDHDPVVSTLEWETAEP